MEEVGCSIEIGDEVGEIVEHRSQLEIVQTSHCFLAKAIEEGEPHFTEEEKADGFELLWVPIDEAIAIIQKDMPNNYQGKFIIKRDLIFLQKAKDLMK